MIPRLALLAALLPLCGFAQMVPIFAGEGATELSSPARLPRKARRPHNTRSASHHYRNKPSTFRRHNSNPSRRRHNRNARRPRGSYAVAHYVMRPEPSREQAFQLPESRRPRSTQFASPHYGNRSSSFRSRAVDPVPQGRHKRNTLDRRGSHADPRSGHYAIHIAPSREPVVQLPEAQP